MLKAKEVVFVALEKELATYHAKLPEWKGNEGKFVLIHEAQVIDTFASYEDAIKEGYARFKLEPFLVKQIQAIEQLQWVTPHFTRQLTSSAPVVTTFHSSVLISS